MQFQFGAVLVFLLVGCAFIFGNLLLGWLVRPRRPNPEKQEIYECGEPTIGTSWIRYNVRFYMIALVYLIFDVEVVFLVPVMLVLAEMRWLAFLEVVVFVLILSLGLVYAWKNGSLDWSNEPDTEGDGGVQEMGFGI